MIVTFASTVGGIGVLCTALLEPGPEVRGLCAKMPCGEYLGIASLAEITPDGIVPVSDRLRAEALDQAWRDAKIATPPMRAVRLDGITWVQRPTERGLQWQVLS